MIYLHLPFRGNYPVSPGGGYDAPRPHRTSGKHEAYDWPLVFEPVYTVFEGAILENGESEAGGLHIGVRHYWGYTYYRHLREYLTQPHELVFPVNGPMAISGQSGQLVEGPNLHVEFYDLLWQRYDPFNPPPGLPGFLVA